VSDRKVIAVVGATGAQVGGLVRAILDDPRTVVSHPDRIPAKAMMVGAPHFPLKSLPPPPGTDCIKTIHMSQYDVLTFAT